MIRQTCILMALLCLLLSGCIRRQEQAAKDSAPPRLTDLQLSPDGEVLPPPSDVAAAPGGAATKRSTEQTSQDQTLVLLAKMAQQQDSLHQKVEKVDERTGIFLPAIESHARQIQVIQEEQLPKMTQKLATVAEQLTQTTQNLERRINALETNTRSSPQSMAVSQLPPSTSQIPQPQRNIASSGVTYVPTPAPVTAAAVIKPRHVSASSAKWTPYAQQLRTQVRSAYEKVIKEFPNSPEASDAYMGLAAMHEEDEDWTAAIGAYQRLLTDFPRSASAPDAQFRLAGVLESRGNYDDARKAYLLAADSFPRNPLAIPALISAADCLARSGKTAEALRDYKGIERSQQDTAYAQTARLKTADLLFKEKRFTEAVEAYRATLKDAVDQRRPELELQLALSQLGAGQYPGARETLTGLLPRANSEAFSWTVQWHLARAFEEEEKPLDAARAFVLLADRYPQNPSALDARMHAAHAYLGAELADHATEQVETVLNGLKGTPILAQEMEPQALYTAARAARMSGETERAKSRLKTLREIYPTHALVLDADLEEANALVESGHAEEAISLLRQIVHRYPSSPRATAVVMRIAELQERSGKASKGITVYSELLNVSSDVGQNAHYRLRRGLLLQEVGRDEEAATIFQSIIDDTNSPKAVAALARYQHALVDQRSGRLTDAIGGYEKFLEEGSGSAPLTGIDLSGLLDDAKWKISKLKWLSTQEHEKVKTPLSGQLNAKPQAL